MDAKQKALRMIWNQIAKEDENYYRSAQMPSESVLSLDHAYHVDNDPMHRCDIARPENHKGSYRLYYTFTEVVGYMDIRIVITATMRWKCQSMVMQSSQSIIV